MSFRTLELPGMRIERMYLRDGKAVWEFADALIIKTMEGARQRSAWRQSGEIVMADAAGFTPQDKPRTVSRGQLHDNVYVYENMIRLPMHSFGDLALRLWFVDEPAPQEAHGGELYVSLYKTPKYIGHLDE